MICQISILVLFVAAASAACQNQKLVSKTQDVKQKASTSGHLGTRLEMVTKTFTTDSVLLSFTVINNANTQQRFCKWETPFELRLGKYYSSGGFSGLETGNEIKITVTNP